MSSFESVGARLAVEHATVKVVAQLRDRSLEVVVLRGPWLARRLYRADETRNSIDVDLLVEDVAAASTALDQLGYDCVVDWTPGMNRHAWTHVKRDAVSVDLHRTLVGVEAPPERVWKVFLRESDETAIGSDRIRVPVLRAHLLIVSLHAAQHGAESDKTMEDLRRALNRYDAAEWALATALARELVADQAFGAGLCLLDRGRELAEALRLPKPDSRTTLLRSETVRPTALGLDRLAQLRGRERASFVLGKAFPPPAFMRDWRPLARRGKAGLVLAYGYRLGWLACWTPRGMRSFRAASRRAKVETSREKNDG
jgi:Uncharacterised nucleotidyltransferase